MGDVVVGVDGSEHSKLALRFAIDEARHRGARVRAVMAWSYLDQHQPGGGTGFRPDYSDADARRAVEQVVAEVAGPDCDVPIVSEAVNELPARALLDATRDADLLVVAARGLGGFKGLMLGSVSQQVVQHAPCPVVVVPAHPER